jgi:hypothetical protein
MIKNIMLLLYGTLLFFFACSGQPSSPMQEPPSHEEWTSLLEKHVRADGMVDYAGFVADRGVLGKYLDKLSEGMPDPENWSENERLAFWINAYNAFTVKLIIDNYPVESIKDLNPAIAIPMVSTVWQKKFFSIGGKDMSLDEIEHDILRKEFDEPRIHFAINCASVSCPPLRNEAYVAGRLDEQLEDQAVQFINDPSRNQLDPEEPGLSRIFSWFGGDFRKNGSLVEFINRYARIPLKEDADISYLPYDWDLNDARKY